MTGLTWVGIFRLGLVQAALGSVVVLTTSTLNRVMAVELALPAVLPGALVALHYAVQILRPRFGHGSDLGGVRTPWIVGGMGVLAVGGIVAAASTLAMELNLVAGLALAVSGFLLIGAGVGACGTSLLVLLAAEVTPERRAAAASLTWILMIVGFIVTTVTVGAWLEPFSLMRLVAITSVVSLIAFVTTLIAVAGVETRSGGRQQRIAARQEGSFKAAIRDVLSEGQTRRFALFVFISMLAYSAQDLLLEPFAGAVFGLTPGASTQLAGIQHGGVLLGMIMVALLGSGIARGNKDALRWCMLAGCSGSAVMLAGLALGSFYAGAWPLVTNVFLLGFSNGVFAVSAIGCMMTLVSQGHKDRDGVRMGVWGAAQAIAFGLGGVVGTLMVDIGRWLGSPTPAAYAFTFALQAIAFLVASAIAANLSRSVARRVLQSGYIEPPRQQDYTRG